MTSLARPSPHSQPNLVRVDVRCLTDTGKSREHNEDAFLVADLTAGSTVEAGAARDLQVGERGLLFMVADGMGGAAAGEVASRMATELVFERLHQRTEVWQGDKVAFVAALHDAAEHANSEIHRFARENPGHDGMGTTATIAGLLGDTLYLAQVGDSRAYLVRRGEARQLTKDQSLIQKLVEVGELTAEEAERSERRNIILQALGPEPEVVIDLTRQQVRREDVLVLCSDGLSGIVRHDEIASLVSEAGSLTEAAEQLIALANARGGPDNITVVLVRFDGPGLQQASPEDDVGYVAFEEAERVRTGEVRAIPRVQPPSDGVSLSAANSASSPGESDYQTTSAAMPQADTERRRKGEWWTSILMLALVGVAIAVAIIVLL